MPFPKAIITKPFLVTDSEYKDLGMNINLVGYDSFNQVSENTKQHASPRLLNWVEPFEVSGVRKTLFYTEVNTNFQVGDRVYIVNGNYDNDALIQKDKYKKGRDGYKILRVDQCKIVLDIDYTGVLPYNDDSFDDYIKVYYIDDRESFINANRQITTRGGTFDYKFNYYQNNIAFIDQELSPLDGWGLNAGVSGTPGFFVREGTQGWSKISDELIYLGSFSVALSPTYTNNGKMIIMDGSFEYNGIQFREGFVYKWNVGPTSSSWQADPSYSPAMITKANFRGGTFNGKFNNGLYGTQQKRIEWSGKGTWNGGSILNTKWKSGTIGSKISISNTYKATFDEYGIPFQKSYTANNGGFGYNYVFDSEMESSLVNNGNFYRTDFKSSGQFSVVEKHVLSITYSCDNRIVKAYFDLCDFKGVQIDGGELKNTRIFNSRVSNSKSINSYFDQSVLKDSTYVSDKIIKILGYDEWNMSEYLSLYSGGFSTIKDVNSKIYKFYISKESFRRMKSEDTFYIKGLKIKGDTGILNFFDTKFRLTSWTEFYDDYSTGTKSITGVDPYSFYKRGFECAAFLSTPMENEYIVNSREGLYNISGTTFSRYNTTLAGKNANAAYSIDIVVSRHDLKNKNQSIDSTSEWDSLNPKDYNYSSDVIVGTTSLPKYLGSNIDISGAYILDSDFGGGIIETSDWNSGHHVNYNNDVVITSVTSSGIYNMEIDNNNDYLIVHTGLEFNYPERIGKEVISEGDIVFLNSVDYDTRGMVTKVTLVTNGSSYSASTDAVSLVNTKVSSLTMSAVGTYYNTISGAATYNTNGKGTGLTLDLTAKEIGSVTGITYSAPMSGGGSYSIGFISSVLVGAGPLASGPRGLVLSMPLTYQATPLLFDDEFGTVTGRRPAQNGGLFATYSNFGTPQTAVPTGATGVGAIFVTGPEVVINGVTASPRSLGVGLTLNYNTSSNGSITKLTINNPGSGYQIGEVFKVEGGNATFSITSVSKGELTSFKIANPGEDYLAGDILDIIKPYDPNFQFGVGLTATVVVTSITVSNKDTKGLSLDLVTGTGPLSGKITEISISEPGLYYSEGEIFTIPGGNHDALVRIDSVEGNVVRLNDTYKVVDSDRSRIVLKDMGAANIIAGLTSSGIFYTTDAKNRWGYISKTKLDRTKIKSGIFKRAYIKNSLIRDIDYDSTDIDLVKYDNIKNLVISDTLFSSNSNILSSATYLYSNIVGGTDIWNDGIINKSVINGLTFSKGTVRQSTWINGNFTGGMFYFSKSFDAKPTIDRPNYLNDRVRSYYMTGNIGATLSNNRYSWRNGKFSGGQFYKSDWENGLMENGTFFYSKFYNGTINGGKIGTKSVAAEDTRIYNGTINYTTVENASVYSEDTSYTGLSSSSIVWMDGVFNNGVFGSNNDDVVGTTSSNIVYKATITSLPIADYKITTSNLSVIDENPILGDFEIDVNLTIKHTYLGDLIINLMSPNGKIINLKRRYSCGSNDNMISTVFTSDSTKPSIEIGTAPYTGEFKFDALPNQGVYYDLRNRLLPNIAYSAIENIIPTVIDYRSSPPSTIYESDRYLVVATSSDPNWVAPLPGTSNPWEGFVGKIVERSSSSTNPWELYTVNANDKVFVKNRSEYLKYIKSGSFTGWTKSYHANATKISELLNTDKTATGTWTLMVMDCAALDSGYVEKFELSLSYRTSYIIKTFKNDAVWHNGIFNAGQFIDLGVWKNGKFNGGKFISTYGYEKSGSYLSPSDIISEYSWQGGEFNGGEFGNESLLKNSTWFNGDFNGGVFKGKLWNNGVFTYGEFKGGASVPSTGNGIKSANADAFVNSFKNEYYGVWRKGTVSDKKDTFLTDKKIFTSPVRAMAPIKLGKTAKFTNMLWVSGTFDHPSGEISNSVWLNGLFKMGTFKSSAFNPYVRRKSDTAEFVKDDSCIWENGKFIESEFHMSKWKYGQFISGTAVGMIWKNGISNYMNAYNIFWENGVWRNGNWYGSNFEYRGKVEDGFAREILNRGIEWSGTSSCHIWNIFESDVDTTIKTVSTLIDKDTAEGGDSFTTTNIDDLGASRPSVEFNPVAGDPYSLLTINGANSVTLKFKISSNGGAPITHAGFIYRASSSLTAAQSNPPVVNIAGGLVSGASGTLVKALTPADFTPTGTWNSTTLGIPTSLTPAPDTFTSTFTITSLDPNKVYAIQAFAVNNQCDIQTGPSKSAIEYFQTALPNDVTLTAFPPTLNTTTGELYTVSGNNYTQSVLKNISLKASYVTTSTNPVPTEKGFFYIVKNVGDPAPTVVDASTATSTSPTSPLPGISGTPTTTFTATLVAQSGKVYYIRAYTKNAGGYGYSPTTMAVTAGATNPTVDLSSVSTTQIIGNVTANGGSTGDLERGFIVRKTGQTSNPNFRPSEAPQLVNASNLNTGVRFIVDTNGGSGNFVLQIESLAGLVAGNEYIAMAYAYKIIAGAPSGDYDNCSAYDYSPTWTSFFAESTVPSVTTEDGATSITTTGATLKATMVNKNGQNVTSTGFVLTTNSSHSYSANPTTEALTALGSPQSISAPNTAFTGAATSLANGQKYYYRAWAQNSKGYSYGSQMSFMTLPDITALSLDTTINTIVPTFTVTSALPISSKGLIYTTALPAPAANWWTTIIPETTDSDSAALSPITALTPNTGYLVVAYAKNTETNTLNTPNTKYSAAQTVYTRPAFLNSIISVSATSILSNGFTIALTPNSGAAVVAGSATISEKGVAYGTNSLPTTEKIANAPSTGLSGYTTVITALATGTKYYYRPYAKNAGGIGYGSEANLTTLASVTLPPSITPGDYISTILQGTSPNQIVRVDIGAPSYEIVLSNTGLEPISRYGLCHVSGTTAPTTTPNIGNGLSSVVLNPPASTAGFMSSMDIPVPATGSVTYKIRVFVENAGGVGYTSKTITIIVDNAGVANKSVSA